MTSKQKAILHILNEEMTGLDYSFHNGTRILSELTTPSLLIQFEFSRGMFKTRMTDIKVSLLHGDPSETMIGAGDLSDELIIPMLHLSEYERYAYDLNVEMV